MAIPTALAEYFVHQTPECLPSVAVHHHHWRESYFYELHDPSGEGDAVFFTMAHYPAQERMDSLQMGRVGGEQVLGLKGRPYDGDPHRCAGRIGGWRHRPGSDMASTHPALRAPQG